MKFHFLPAVVILAIPNLWAATGQEDCKSILKRSLDAQQAWRTVSGEYRSMFTNFAPSDDSPAADHRGHFIIGRSETGATVDRLFIRDHDYLKGETRDSSTQYADGNRCCYIAPDGTGEEWEMGNIQNLWAVSIFARMEARTRQMMDSAATVRLPDTLIDGRSCYLFALRTVSQTPDDRGEGWYKLAIDRESLLPVWQARRDRISGGFDMDQSDTMELHRLRIDEPVAAKVFKVPDLRRGETTPLGSCNTGEMAPLWKGVRDAVTGRLYSLDSLLGAGNVVVMDWSTSTCGVCIMAMPTIDSLYRHYRLTGAKVKFLMMNPSDSRKQALSLIERKGIEYPVLLCPETVADAYGLYAFPVFLVVGRDGLIVFNQGGFGKGSPLYQRLKDAVDKALLMENE